VSNRIRIKICGITNCDDAALAIELGADALGFIMVPESKRYVPSDEVDRIIASLAHFGPFISYVAVVRNVVDARNVERVDCAQYYEGSPLDGNGRQRLIPVLRVRTVSDLLAVKKLIPQAESGLDSSRHPSIHAILLDTYSEKALGGAGATFDWHIAQSAKSISPLPIIVAGGMNPGNVVTMLDSVRPYGVDVSSGVEASPGKKDPSRMRDFIQAVRGWETSTTP
jgi:phosphoribosylanthranilate isomerase